MSGRTVIPISAHPQVGKISEADYFRLYGQSLVDPDHFWAEHGKRIAWIKPFTKVKNTSFDPHNVSIRWFEDGTTNSSRTVATSQTSGGPVRRCRVIAPPPSMASPNLPAAGEPRRDRGGNGPSGRCVARSPSRAIARPPS